MQIYRAKHSACETCIGMHFALARVYNIKQIRLHPFNSFKKSPMISYKPQTVHTIIILRSINPNFPIVRSITITERMHQIRRVRTRMRTPKVIYAIRTHTWRAKAFTHVNPSPVCASGSLYVFVGRQERTYRVTDPVRTPATT